MNVDKICDTCAYSTKTLAALEVQEHPDDHLTPVANERWCWCPTCFPGVTVGDYHSEGERFKHIDKWSAPVDAPKTCECDHWAPDLGMLARPSDDCAPTARAEPGATAATTPERE